MNALRILLIGAATTLLFGCSQAHMTPHSALGDDLTIAELSNYTHFYGQQPISRIDAHLTEEEVKNVEDIVGKPVSERSIHYFHLRKKRAVEEEHGVYFTMTDAKVRALVFVQHNRVSEIQVIKGNEVYQGEEYAILNSLLRMSVYELKNVSLLSGYRESSKEVRELIDKLIVAMAILEVVHKES